MPHYTLECLHCGAILALKHPHLELVQTPCSRCGRRELELRRWGMPLPLARACKGCSALLDEPLLRRDRRIRFCPDCRGRIRQTLPPEKLKHLSCPRCGGSLRVRAIPGPGGAPWLLLECPQVGFFGRCGGRVNEVALAA